MPGFRDPTYPDAPCFRAPILIGADETIVNADNGEMRAIGRAFDDFGGAVFHDVLTPDLLRALSLVADRADFRQVDLSEFGRRGNDLSAQSALPFCVALARPVFFRWLEAISGCDPVSHVEGHLVQMMAGNNLGWHRDAGLGIRRLAMVINLTTQPYEGGWFELRHKKSRRPKFTYHADVPGSLAVFRLDGDLQHQVTRVEAGGPRISFSGWARRPWSPTEAARDIRLAAWPPLQT